MADIALVDAGRKLIQALEEEGADIRSAFWMQREESKEWRLVLATTKVATAGKTAAYDEIMRVFRRLEDELDGMSVDDLVAIDPGDKLIGDHRFLFGPVIGRKTVVRSATPPAVIYRLEPLASNAERGAG